MNHYGPTVIWEGKVFQLAEHRTIRGRCVRRGDRELFFEYEDGYDRMGSVRWTEQGTPFREFLLEIGDKLVRKVKA